MKPEKSWPGMTHDDTQHYFETLDTTGQWHRYRVDYTIGAKWQQTYATRLPTGESRFSPSSTTGRKNVGWRSGR